jgi:hypothetical protein
MKAGSACRSDFDAKEARAMKTKRNLIIGLSAVAGLSLIVTAGSALAQFPSPGEILKRSKVRKPAPVVVPAPANSPAAETTTSTASAASQGITSTMHQAHLGQVVFTRTELDRQYMTEAALVSSFNLGDPIFFRVYMREPVIAQLMPKLPGKSAYWVSRATRYKARFTVGGQVVDTNFRIWGKAGDHETWTTWRGELLSRDVKFQPGTEVFREFLSRATRRGLMGVGTHQIKLEIIPYAINLDGDVNYNGSSNEPPVATGDVVASGEFSLTVNPGSYSKSDPKICGWPPAQSNPALEQQILGKARLSWTRPEAPPVKVVLTHSAWNYKRHPLSGLILERNIDAQIMSRGKDYCDFQGYNYIQPNAGGYSPANSSFVSEPHNWFVPCSCLD